MNVVFFKSPAAHFASAEAIAEFSCEAARYETAVADYELTGDEASLWEALSALGYSYGEIQWHIEHPGKRMPRGFA